jgi:hypothetical protein
LVGALNNLKFLGNRLQPVIGIQRIRGTGIGRRVVAHKLLMLIPQVVAEVEEGVLIGSVELVSSG